jgi:hypothetical protein
MPIETNVNGIQDLNPDYPTAVDPKSQGDDHIRLIKSAVQDSFPGMTDAWVTTQKINCVGVDSGAARITSVGAATASDDAVTKAVTDALNTRVTDLEDQATRFQSFGAINSNGSIRGGSGDFTVLRTGTGVYRITFTEAATAVWNQVIIVDVIGTAPFVGEVAWNSNADTVTQCTVYTFAGNGNAADLNFMFNRIAD